MWLFCMIYLIFILFYVVDVFMFKYLGVYIMFDNFIKLLNKFIFNLFFNYCFMIGELEIDEFFKLLIFIEKRNIKEKMGIVMLRKRFKFKLGGVLKDIDFFFFFYELLIFFCFFKFLLMIYKLCIK